MERNDILWDDVLGQTRKLMVQILGTFLKQDVYGPIQFPVAEFTLIYCNSIEVRVPGKWIYALCDAVLRLHHIGSTSVEETLRLSLLDLEPAIAQSFKITRCLWSAYRAHWDKIRIDGKLLTQSSVVPLLSASCMFYLPMCGPEQEFIPFLKYQLSWLFARGFEQEELPERPNWIWHTDGLLLAGSLGKVFKRQCFGRKLCFWEFRNTVLHGIKKGLPQMGDFHLAANLSKHSKRLLDAVATSEEALEQVERTTREIFPKKLLVSDWCEFDECSTLSSNACFESSRKTDGPLGLVWALNYFGWTKRSDFQELMEVVNKSKYTSYYRSTSFEDVSLYRMYYLPRMNDTISVHIPSNSFVQEELSSLRSFSYNELSETGSCGIILNRSIGHAAVKAIFEPLKVRLITAGDLLSNGLWTGLQKALWRQLQNFQQFSLTGKSIDPEDIVFVNERSFSGFNKWISGDYSAATDNMHMDVTLAMIGQIAGDLETFKVLERGLTGNYVTYDSMDYITTPSPFVMERGQLMGCVFSFVLLCIANIAMYRWAYEQRDVLNLGPSDARTKIKDLGVLVNGDDILFKGDSALIVQWENNIKDVGFEKSIGKNYVSQDFCVINSCLFDVRKIDAYAKPVVVLPRKIPYLNMGWVTGISKGGGSHSKNKDMVDVNEKDIRRIRAQVEKTEEEWYTDFYSIREDGPRINALQTRRLSTVQRFKEEIFFHNKKEIFENHLPLDKLPGGLGLSDRICTDAYANGFRKFLKRNDKSGFDQSRIVDHTEIQAIDVCPRALGPWKLAMLHAKRPTLEVLGDDYRSVTKNLAWKPNPKSTTATFDLIKKRCPVFGCLPTIVANIKTKLVEELREWDTLSSIEQVLFDGLRRLEKSYLVEVIC